MLLVIGHLFFPAPVCLVNGKFHAFGDLIRIKYHFPIYISGRTPCRLGQRAVRTQESLLIRIQDSYQGNLRQIQSFTEQIHSDQHIKQPFPQIIHNLHPLQRIHIAMNIITPDPHTRHVGGQLFRHALGQRRDQDPFVYGGPLGYLLHQIINLIQCRAYFYHGIQQSGRTNHLVYHYPFTLFQFIVRRCGTDINGTRRKRFKFLKSQRTIIHSRRKAEPIIHKILFPGIIPSVHRTDLRYRHMALIHHQ